MPQIFVNNGRARLNTAISSSQTTIQLRDRVNLPNSLAAGDWFLLTISNDDSRYGSNHEVVRVTGVSGDTITVVRGYEGAAVAHAVTEVVEARSTADTHGRMIREAVWSHVSDKPLTATRWPTWAEVTDKPTTFAPSSHTHPWAEVTGVPATATRWPTWSEVTSKPGTFPPSTHGHAWSEVVEAPETATRWPTWDEVANRPATTASRTNSSTTTLLQAKSMNDHRQSADHDSRYHTKAGADVRYAQLGAANTLTGDLTINRPSAATAGVRLTGGRTGTAGAVGSVTVTNAEDANKSASIEVWRRAAGTLDLELTGFRKTAIAAAVEIANGLTLQNANYNNIDLYSDRATGNIGGIRFHRASGVKAGELNFTADGKIQAAVGAQFSGDGGDLTNLDASSLAAGTVPNARLPATATRWPAFTEVTSPPATATRWPTWSEVTSKPTTFTPTTHAHAAADITSGVLAKARIPTLSVGDVDFTDQAVATTSHVRHATVRTGGATDDGVNSLQAVGGTRTDTLAAGGVQDAQESIDTAGNVQIRGEGQLKMGGFAIQFNAATQSLDFNFMGA